MILSSTIPGLQEGTGIFWSVNNKQAANPEGHKRSNKAWCQVTHEVSAPFGPRRGHLSIAVGKRVARSLRIAAKTGTTPEGLNIVLRLPRLGDPVFNPFGVGCSVTTNRRLREKRLPTAIHMCPLRGPCVCGQTDTYDPNRTRACGLLLSSPIYGERADFYECPRPGGI